MFININVNFSLGLSIFQFCCFIYFFQSIIVLRRSLFDPPPEDTDYQRLPEEQPGGFQWGRQANENQNNENM